MEPTRETSPYQLWDYEKFRKRDPLQNPIGRRRISRTHDYLPEEKAALRRILIATGAVLALSAGVFLATHHPIAPDNSLQIQLKTENFVQKAPQQKITTYEVPVVDNNSQKGFTQFLFRHYTPAKVRFMREQVNYQMETFLKTRKHAQELYTSVRQWKNLINQVVEQASSDPRFNIKPAEKPFLKNLLLLQMGTESRGDQKAKSKRGATGLTQVMEIYAPDIASALEYKKYDLYDPKTNITFGLYELQRQRRNYSTLEMALASYNLGEGVMINLLKNYLKNNLQLNPSQVDNDFKTMGADGTTPPATFFYTNRYEITLADLAKSKSTGELAKELGIDPIELSNYVARIYSLGSYYGFLNLDILDQAIKSTTAQTRG